MFQTCFAGGARLISIQSSNAQEANTAYVIMRTGSHTSWAIDIKVLTADDTGAGCHFPAITQSKQAHNADSDSSHSGPEFWLGAWASIFTL